MIPVERLGARDDIERGAGEWQAGRWRVLVKRPIGEGLAITPGEFLPVLLSVQDGIFLVERAELEYR